MENLDESENNGKVSDSGYSNSCSNSQSRRSHSSKSTHSGSRSSGSSGYGGNPSTSNSSNELSQQPKKEKDPKKKKQTQVETLIADSQIEGGCRPQDATINAPSAKEGSHDVLRGPTPSNFQTEKGEEKITISTPVNETIKDEGINCNIPATNGATISPVPRSALSSNDGFSCVISMQDGVVMYTTSSLTSTLGFPKDMWIGRSFIDFVHPRDRNTFASQITSGLAAPKIVNGTHDKAQPPGNHASAMVCRIRRYKGLKSGFGVKATSVSYMPFLLKFTFKNISDDEGKAIYLVIQTTPFFSAFKTPNEVLTDIVSFIMRHDANGNLEYIDPEAVPYLGYLPQDITNSDALMLYHPGDLSYLQEVYESIVKEVCVTRSKPYRMMTQNGHHIKVETEWSAFINPWSRKLEFVTGKHHIIEGPANPDVFEYPDPEKFVKVTEEEKNTAKMYREGIIRIMNEVLTKPAEIAKQQMSKRCQDLAAFMENLMEELPKGEDDLQLEIQDADYSYYERDSVMLGGISPHHDYNDSKSSTETPLSYNQLNYNNNLQRYFNSHQSNAFVDCNMVPLHNLSELPKLHTSASKCRSPVAINSGDSSEMTSSGESSGLAVVGGISPGPQLGNYQYTRLTESLLTKHNAKMEKELMKNHREHRSCSKGDRKKVSNEAKQKKKEHLARCNASFQTVAVAPNIKDPIYKKPHGVKRSSMQIDSDASAHKHHCPSSRQPRRKHITSSPPVQSFPTMTTTVASPWPANNPVNNMNTYILGVGIQPPMSLMSPLPAVTGMFPMYYTPTTAATITSTHVSPSNPNVPHNNNDQQQCPPPIAQYMMYGQPVYGSPIMYSPIGPNSSYMHQTLMAQSMHYNNALNPLCLTNSNYEEACRPSIPPSTSTTMRRFKKRGEKHVSKHQQANIDADSTSDNRIEATESTPSGDTKPSDRMDNSEETIGRTDGESSFSSFYSSFFKTESGSAEDSSDPKSTNLVDNKDQVKNTNTGCNTINEHNMIKAPRRKVDPPWMEQMCVTSELVYKYQVVSKTMEEVLLADRQKIKAVEQSSLVNEQLGQLYLDLQLEGVAARLTLEEGITSSSSSEDTSITSKGMRRKREHSKLVMIYEENAPLPSPPNDTLSISGNSMS